MTAKQAAAGGTTATALLTRLRKRHWFGSLLFGNQTFTSQAPQHVAVAGRFADEANSATSWGKMTTAYYFSGDSRESCILDAMATPRLVHAGADYVGLNARLRSRRLDVYVTTDGVANSEWQVTVKIESTDGTRTKLHRHFELDETANGGVTFHDVGAIRNFRRISVLFAPAGRHGRAPIWTVVTAQ
jgi:hypothetical protein